MNVLSKVGRDSLRKRYEGSDSLVIMALDDLDAKDAQIARLKSLLSFAWGLRGDNDRECGMCRAVRAALTEPA